jgi:hypothetical protein
MISFLLTVVFLVFSCAEPSPLYGTWTDNRGDKLSFFDDNTFNATFIYNSISKNYEGNYSVLLNSLTFNCTSETLTVVSEWDIRGNMLYLNWPQDDGSVAAMTLFKISN